MNVRLNPPSRIMGFLAATALLSLAAGCAGTADTSSKEAAASLSASAWTLETLGSAEAPATIPAGIRITLELDGEDRISGSAGCNTYTGTVTIEGQGLRCGPLSRTKRLCNDPAGVMDLENQYMTTLQDVTRYEISGDTLTLFGDAKETLVFRSGGRTDG